MKIWSGSWSFSCDIWVARIIPTRMLKPTRFSTLAVTLRDLLVTPEPRLHVLVCALLLFLAAAVQPAMCQTSDRPSFLDDHSPGGALWRAAAIPGWGQLYNREYYKIPVVWAGLGGITASAIVVNRRYLLYRHAYHFLARRENGVPVFPEYESDFLKLINDIGITRERAETSVGAFRQSRDNLRRNRDLLYIGIGLFYGLTILDAYVSAHLLQFDVGEDLTLHVQPVPAGLSASLRLGH